MISELGGIYKEYFRGRDNTLLIGSKLWDILRRLGTDEIYLSPGTKKRYGLDYNFIRVFLDRPCDFQDEQPDIYAKIGLEKRIVIPGNLVKHASIEDGTVAIQTMPKMPKMKGASAALPLHLQIWNTPASGLFETRLETGGGVIKEKEMPYGCMLAGFV